MSDISTQQVSQMDIDYEAAIAQVLSDMQHIREMMDIDQADIDRLKAETQCLKTETRAMISTLRTMVAPC